MINTPYDVVQKTCAMALKKYHTPTIKLFVLGMLAGVYIAMGALLSSMAAGGLAGIGETNPIVPKLVSGMTFPVGLLLVILVGAELFTGNTAYLMPATIKGTVPRTYFLKNWGIVYVANLAGALLFDYFLVYQADMLHHEAYHHYITHIAEYKTSLPWEQVFLRGIGANWMVCLAVWLGFSSKSMAGQVMGIWWPVMAFVAIGFEHSVANMFYIPTGMMYGANVSISDFICNNLIPSTLGNIVGGGLLVGCLYGYFYKNEAKH
ncbi:MAG: formate/nitrite transporter family protein [Alloprevotella sp.]|nr:formate/nitrite transporter family protein [Bacteroidales bacterium]MDY3943744.1 formate/nitrite transporter family protein [Alloprevotella sp.]